MGVSPMTLTAPRFPIRGNLLPVPARRRLSGGDLDHRRVLLTALFRGVGTSRVELAARREVYQIRRGAWDRAQLLLLPDQRGHRIEKADRVRVARVVEDPLDLPELDDAAGVSRGHPVSQLGGQRKVVGDEDHGEAVLVFQGPQHLDYGPLGQHVERGGWFVQYQNLRVQKEAERDHDPLAHAAGELVREGSEHPVRIQLHHLQALRGSFREGTALERPVGLAVVLCGVGKVVADAHYRVECVQGRREHHRALTPAEAPEILVVEGRQVQRLFRGGTEDDLAPCDRGVLRQQTHQGEPEGRLARAALAYEGQALVIPEVETDPAHRPYQAPARRVAYLQVTYAQNILAAFHPSSLPPQPRVEDLGERAVHGHKTELKKGYGGDRRHDVEEAVLGEDRPSCPGQVDHHAPVVLGERHEPEERQADHGIHAGGYGKGEVDGDVACHVGRDLAKNDVRRPQAQRPGRLDVVTLLQREHLGPYCAHQSRPEQGPDQGRHGELAVEPKDACEDGQKRKLGDGKHYISQPGKACVGTSAHKTAQRPEGYSNGRRDGRGQESYRQDRSTPVDDLKQHILSLGVGAKRMAQRGRLIDLVYIYGHLRR